MNYKDALKWLNDNPKKELYNQYGNYVIYIPEKNIIEYYWFDGDYEDDEGNIEPGYWDFEKYNIEEFIEHFDSFGDLEI